MPWLGFQGGKGFAVLSGALIVLNPWGILLWWGSLPIWLFITRYSSIGGIASTATVATGLTFFSIFEATAWHEMGLIVFGWGCTIVCVLRMIPDFKLIKKGEITPWKGLQISQWMK
jgi:glycerol-3-phosphate acyltransferase PlsY